ncbi:hypothetical protein [Nakamurella endophytica]|nr:hypothetical protein [Nakamurella endophytica]
MGSKTNRAVTARQQARQRWAALTADRAARDSRIEEAAAAVIDAAEQLAAITGHAAEERAAAHAAYDAAVAKIDRAENDALGAAEPALAAGLAALTGEGVKAADIASLTGLPLADVRRLTVKAAAPADSGAPATREGAGAGADSE